MNNINNNSYKEILNKKKKLVISLSVFLFLLICFGSTYYITDYFTNSNRNNSNVEENKKDVFSNNNYLSDDIYITLKTNDNVDMVDTLSNIKSKFKLKDNITEEELSEALSKDGYKLYEKNKQKFTYIRNEEINSDKFEANKYYLGEENGYIAIFKTDENGNIIESEKKVYTDSKPISNLPEVDQNYIREYKFYSDNKDDILQKLSEMIS